MNVYLCSRVALDARPLNDEVAKALRAAGHEVYVPHEQPINNYSGATDGDIYQQDHEAMLRADVCVAVGRVGVDCAYEIGWFDGRNVPVYHYLRQEHGQNRCPMLWATYKTDDLQELITWVA